MAKKITVDDFDFTNQLSDESACDGEPSEKWFLNDLLYKFASRNRQKATLKNGLCTIGSGPNWMRFLQRGDEWWVLFNAQQWGWMGGDENVSFCADEDLSKLLSDIHNLLAFDNILK